MRYVMHNALSWSDELAVILLLWLAMLGAVVAFRRGEHIRMTALLRRVGERTKNVLDAIAAVVVSIFVIEVMPATLKFFQLEQIDLTPALNIPRSYVVLAIMVGLTLILILALLRLSEMPGQVVAAVVAGALVVSAAAWFGRGAFAALGNFNLLLFFVGLVGACIAIGVPIAFSFGVGTLSYLAITTQVPLNTVVSRMDEGISSLVLLAVPLFIFLGLIMENAGIARRLVEALASLVGHLRGGLNIVLVAAMYLVSGISGSKIADMAAVAPVLFPDMERRGQKRTGMIALLATSGAMAETIPPSLVLIIIGSVTGVSIGALFTAGLLPALVCSLFLVAVALYQAGREAATPTARAPLSVITKTLLVAIPGLLLPLLIRYFVVAGIATATEVSVVGIIYTLLVGVFVYREFDWRRAYPTLLETVSLSGAILLIIATATAMGWALTQSGFAQQLADILAHAPGGRLGIMLLSVVLFVILGSVLEGIPAMVLFGPLLFPVAKAAGINEVHYAIVAVLSMGVGLFAPPLGIGYYSACAIGKADPEAAVVPILPYLGALVLALLVVALVPWISLVFLPKSPM
jgi:tripartite ATP-independent transporter DctM subunit